MATPFLVCLLVGRSVLVNQPASPPVGLSSSQPVIVLVDSPAVRPVVGQDDNVSRRTSGALGTTVPPVRDGDKA